MEKEYGDELFIYAMALMEEKDEREREAQKKNNKEAQKIEGEEGNQE
ncbi:MAG: hypothetical protein FWG61_07920 [Firmicutes bacterium]|nr:hypothetical protein [Bacillota bacterium]